MLPQGASSFAGVGKATGATPYDLQGDAFGNRGWGEKLCHAMGMGFMNISRPSDTLEALADPAKTAHREALARLSNCNFIISQTAPNDLGSNTLVQMKADYSAIVDRMQAKLPTAKVVPPTITPRTSSTNLWTAPDGSDQTNTAGSGIGSTGAQWNDDICAGVAPFNRNSGKYLDAGYALEIPGQSEA